MGHLIPRSLTIPTPYLRMGRLVYGYLTPDGRVKHGERDNSTVLHGHGVF